MLTQETAETIALRALAWIAREDDMLSHFLNATGAQASDLTKLAQDVDFLRSVLDFILMDDAWIMAFCEAEDLRYDMPAEARRALPGGETPHWT